MIVLIAELLNAEEATNTAMIGNDPEHIRECIRQPPKQASHQGQWRAGSLTS